MLVTVSYSNKSMEEGVMAELQGKAWLDERHESHFKKPKVEAESKGEAHSRSARGKREATNGSNDEEFRQFVERLRAECTIAEIRLLCEANGIEPTGPEEVVLLRCADQMFYGLLEPCPMCGGSLEFAGNEYRCTGYFSEWSKCNYSTCEARRENEPFKIPPELQENEFLREWEEKQKQRHRELEPMHKVLTGMTIVLAGRLSCLQYVWRDEIEKYGGKVANAVREGVTCVVASEHEVLRGRANSKLHEAVDKGVPVVSESWLIDSIKRMIPQPFEPYDLTPQLRDTHEQIWDRRDTHQEFQQALWAEIKLVGKRGVYKDSNLEKEGGKIYEKDGIIYNCAFTICDQAAGINDFAVIQLVDLPHGKFYLYYKKAHVGDRIATRERLEEYEGPEEGIQEFEKYFEEVTGNEFQPWERERKFSKKQGKFFPLDMAEGVDARAGGLGPHQLGVAAAHTKLNARVGEDCKILFAQETYRFAMLEMGIDDPDLPLGNLTDYHLNLCEQVLVEFAEFLKSDEKNEKKREFMCLDFSNKWFTLLYTTRPCIIRNLVELAETASDTLQSLRAIAVASRIIGDMGKFASLSDPFADRYSKIGCEINPLDKHGSDYKMVSDYFSKTMECLKMEDKDFGALLEDSCWIDSKASPSLKEILKIPNKLLIWCGTRVCNVLACMHGGIPPRIIQAPVPGYMFGRGIYCSDAATEAAEYCRDAAWKALRHTLHGVEYRAKAYLMLSIVALGERVVELRKPEGDMSKYEEEKVAIKGLGRKKPDEKEYIKFKHDITVPCGSLVPSGYDDAILDYNEYCVYDCKQVRPTISVRIKIVNAEDV